MLVMKNKWLINIKKEQENITVSEYMRLQRIKWTRDIEKESRHHCL